MSAPTRRECSSGARRGMRCFVVLACLSAAVAGFMSSTHVQSQERNFAGSMQTNYMWVPSDPNAHKQTFDGFSTELSLKVAVDFSDNVSANVKFCYGCHGIDVDMAFADLRVVDELNFRIGRFNPAFGQFPLRHDPANHLSSDKPLPYDMGQMLHMREFNLGVLPAPYTEQGAEVDGTHWFGTVVQLDYAGYVVGGLRGGQSDLDLNWTQSRSVYYVDNNSEPAFGGRISTTLNASDSLVFTLGASGTVGHYDALRQHAYTILGADFYAQLGPIDLRAEYLMRRTQMAMSEDPSAQFRYGPAPDGGYANFFHKDGFYIEASTPLSRRLEVFGRFDGLRRMGNVPVNSPLRKRSTVLRYTTGLNIIFDNSLRLKLSGEYYDFSDFEDAIVAHAAVAAAF